jgi:hypothetical protein
MEKRKLIVAVSAALLAVTGIIWAADHLDAPAVSNTPSDITDVYAFECNSGNLVLVANTQGFLTPAATAQAKFDENTLIEFNIDENNDNIEDLVIQCIYKDGKMNVYGPVKPSETGARSKLEGAPIMADITPYGEKAKITAKNNLQIFAGPRDDPFFFDLDQFKKVVAGTEPGFKAVGTDTFAGTNVLSIVVELPKSMFKAADGSLNVWLETKKKI